MDRNILEYLNILMTITLFSLIGFSVTLAAISIQNDFDFGNQWKIINLLDPTEDHDAATKGYVDSVGAGAGTLHIVASRGSSTTLGISVNTLTAGYNSTTGTIYLADGLTEEGNIERVNKIIGQDDLHLISDPDDNAAVYIDEYPAAISFYITGTEIMKADSSGNIGIGTGNPFSRLHIKDGQDWGTDLSLEATNGTRWLLISTSDGASEGPGKFLIKDNNATDSVRMAIDSGAGTIDINNSTLKNLIDPVDDQDAATKHYIDNIMPPGTILMYNGTGIVDASTRFEEIGGKTGDSISMPGWYVCNGQSSTPDLRNKFIRSESQAGREGGSDDAVVVSHTHTGIADSGGAHTHLGTTTYAGEHAHTGVTESAGLHTHPYRRYCGDNADEGDDYETQSSYKNCYNDTLPAGEHTHAFETDTGGGHSHSVIIEQAGEHSHTLTINPEGTSGEDKNMPRYYSLIFICYQGI